MKYKEFEKDLFTVPKHFALVHCISADVKMGAGIAKLFRRHFPSMAAYIKDQSPGVGDTVMYDESNQVVFNLVTKDLYYNKPTYSTLESALSDLREQMIKSGIKKIAMPAIGSGLDKLEWRKVRNIIHRMFKDDDVKIAVCFV